MSKHKQNKTIESKSEQITTEDSEYIQNKSVAVVVPEQNSSENFILVVAGPTATGKTDFAIRLSSLLNGEVVNADSTQVYKYFDIGTNKGELHQTDEDLVESNNLKNAYWSDFAEDNINKEDIPDDLIKYYKRLRSVNFGKTDAKGWLFDFIEPNEEFNLYYYQQLAYIVCDNLLAKGKIPILTGGTGLYIDSLIRDYRLLPQTKNQERRNELNKLTVFQLQQLASQKASESFNYLNNSHRNNPHRLIRLIEKSELKNTTDLASGGNDDELTEELKEIQGKESELNRNIFPVRDLLLKKSVRRNLLKSQSINNAGNAVSLKSPIRKLNYRIFYPDYDREKLFAKIAKRAVNMLDQGLIAETQQLINRGFHDTKPMTFLGYAQVVDYLDGKINRTELEETVVTAHRQYAIRQITWFEGTKRGYHLERVDFEKISDAELLELLK